MPNVAEKSFAKQSAKLPAHYQLGLFAANNPASRPIFLRKAMPSSQLPRPARTGMLFFNRRTTPAAVPIWKNNRARPSKNAHLHNFLGSAITHEADVEGSLEYRVRSPAPNLSEAHLNLAYAYQLQNQPEDALAEYKTAANSTNIRRFVPGIDSRSGCIGVQTSSFSALRVPHATSRPTGCSMENACAPANRLNSQAYQFGTAPPVSP